MCEKNISFFFDKKLLKKSILNLAYLEFLNWVNIHRVSKNKLPLIFELGFLDQNFLILILKKYHNQATLHHTLLKKQPYDHFY